MPTAMPTAVPAAAASVGPCCPLLAPSTSLGKRRLLGRPVRLVRVRLSQPRNAVAGKRHALRLRCLSTAARWRSGESADSWPGEGEGF